MIGPYQARTAGEPPTVVLAGGIGPAAAAAATATALALVSDVRLVLSVGIAGGFTAAGVRVGDVALATTSVFADLGADSPDGFRSATSLGWAADYAAPPVLASQVRAALESGGLAVHCGPIVTVSTVTGTAARAALLTAAYRPVAEAMEGAAVAAAADRFGWPVLELRAVSNLVGDRDRSAWDIAGALQALRRAMTAVRPILSTAVG